MAVISENDFEKSISKLNTDKRFIEEDLWDLDKIIGNMNASFKTDNNDKFSFLRDEFDSKGIIFNHIIKDEVIVLERNLTNYRAMADEVANDFRKMI